MSNSKLRHDGACPVTLQACLRQSNVKMNLSVGTGWGWLRSPSRQNFFQAPASAEPFYRPRCTNQDGEGRRPLVPLALPRLEPGAPPLVLLDKVAVAQPGHLEFEKMRSL